MFPRKGGEILLLGYMISDFCISRRVLGLQMANFFRDSKGGIGAH